MEFYVLLRRRRNVYGFLSRAIRAEMLMRVLEAATHVPSAGFAQDFDFIVVKKEETKRRLAEAAYEEEYIKLGARRGFLSNAPVIVVPCGNKASFEAKYGKPAEVHSRLPWWLIDAAFASLVLVLSAFQEGLAASFIGALDDQKVIQILHLPKDGSLVPLAVIPIGYKHPGEKRFWKKRFERLCRRPLDGVIHWDRW